MLFAGVLLATVLGADIASEVLRAPQPDGLSALARVADGSYLAVDDSGGQMFTVRMAIDATQGKILKTVVTNRVLLAGVVDGEGLAYDPLHKTVWVADEKHSHISEHDIATGRRLAEIKMPEHFRRARLDVEIESLTISTDGLIMWTATEEAVAGDGEKATTSSGSVVRLQRFLRASGKEAWTPRGQFAYVVDPMAGKNFRKSARSGLSDLCLLKDGTLLALEREFSVKGFLPSFRMRIYRIDFRNATDISGVLNLSGTRFNTVGKTLLLDADTGFAMYEGICLGPRLLDGRQTLLLISDGDGEAIETVMSVVLREDVKKGKDVK